jgi:uncharacterized membrane-anchored protein
MGYLWAIIVFAILAFIAHLWGLIRVGRSSTVRALLMFFLPISAVLYVIKYWGDERSDFRLPFLLSVSFYGLFYYSLHEGAAQFVKDATTEAAQAKYVISQFEKPEGDKLDRKIAIGKAQAGVSFVGGRTLLPEAHATVDVPDHFRFARAKALEPIAQAMGRTILPGTIGWILHDGVSLSDNEPWIIEVHWYGMGHVVEGPAESLAPDALLAAYTDYAGLSGDSIVGDWEWKGFVYRPEWNATRGILAWSEKTWYGEPKLHLVDSYADLPGRKGVLTYELEFVREDRAEMAFRSVRLLASRTQFDPDWGPSDYSRIFDKNSGKQLADLVSGRAFEQ